MKRKIFCPSSRNSQMNIVCFVSGSGTNYREISRFNLDNHYLVFTNRPGCKAIDIARSNNHEVIELDHLPYLENAKNKYKNGLIPRNCTERLAYEQAVVRLIESKLGQQPDIICLAGYDLWSTDWFIDRYYPKIMNVHPGDTTKAYTGLHWIPTAKAIINHENILRSTLFFVDKGADTGPVLMQSAPLNIENTLSDLSHKLNKPFTVIYQNIKSYLKGQSVSNFKEFKSNAAPEMLSDMELICSALQDVLKEYGDWKIYPFGVHELIGRGRVEMDERKVYIDGQELPDFGYRLDDNA